MMLEQVLKREDHHVVVFKDGNEALKAYEENADYDVVFSDWELSGMDGLDLVRRIRQIDGVRGRNCYIILTAERGGKWDIMHAMAMGANDMITKPYTQNLVTERLSSAITHFMRPPGQIKPLESDPVAHLLEEHKMLRFQGKKLEEIMEKYDEEANNKLMNWLGGSSFALETKVHQEKENSFSITFLERLIKAQGEAARGILESSAESVEKEHQDLEKVVETVRDSFKEYMDALADPKQDDIDFNISEHIEDYPAFCLKCDKKVKIDNGSLFKMDSGSYGFKGECAECGSGVTAFIGKSIGISQKNIKLNRSLKKYLRILDEHLGREEISYFPLVNRYFTQADRERLMTEFKRIEEKHGVERVGKDFRLLN
jgi:CheY-like chemotaxis protein/hemerythrin-like domain-containing protein